MVPLLFRVFRFAVRSGWQASLILIAVLFLVGYPIISLNEPPHSGLTSLPTYAWWFVVTITTVGYGDVAPVSAMGKAMAVIIMLGGIGSIGLVITQLSNNVAHIGRQIMQGTADFENKLNGHIVIFGYHPGKTEQLIREIRADEHRRARDVLLCFSPAQADENPLPDKVPYAVKGELSSQETLMRANVEAAHRIVIVGATDDQTINIALGVVRYNDHAHIVAALHEPHEYAETIKLISERIECVPEEMTSLTTQALQDPGITQFYDHLLSNRTSQTIYQLTVPVEIGQVTFGDLMQAFKTEYDATLVGLVENPDVTAQLRANPSWHHPVEGGMILYYIASDRLDEVRWKALIPDAE